VKNVVNINCDAIVSLQNAVPEKRGRGRGTKRKSDADMMAEGKPGYEVLFFA
jgi:hypothetical protein